MPSTIQTIDTYRVALSNRRTRIIDTCGDTNFLQLVAQRSYKGLEVAVRAQWNNENLGWRDCRREGQNTASLILLACPVDVFAKGLFLISE